MMGGIGWVPASALSAVSVMLLLKSLEVITRHGLLLAGQCLPQSKRAVGDAREAVESIRFYRYRVRLQSLESVAAGRPFAVTIRASTARVLSKAEEDRAVVVLAGWKVIKVTIVRLRNGTNEFLWKATFPGLPAYDTWSFEIELPAIEVHFSIESEGGRRRRLFPSFGQYFEPDDITVLSSDSGEPRISGPVVFPRPILPWILSLLAVSVYLLLVGLDKGRWSLDDLRDGDAGTVVVMLFFIWVGYAAMRRRVYPVIQGYRFVSPPWSHDSNPRDATDTHPEPNGTPTGGRFRKRTALGGQ